MKRLLILLALLTLTACTMSVPVPTATSEPPAAAEPVTIRLMTHDSFNISEDVLQQFEAETGITVELFPAGDAGAMLNQAILAKDDPLADVLYGVDNTFLSRALENDIFIPYDSPELANLDDGLKLDPQNRALPVDYGDVCLNYDLAWFAEQGIDPPDSLEDLTDPAYANLTVVENPATSSPGLAFLLATVGHFGEENYLDFWQQMVENGMLVTNGWEDAYWGQFSAASDGDRPIVVSYASSPPAEVFFADPPIEEAPTAAVVSDGSCFRQIEFVGVLAGTEHEAEAKQLVDFMLGTTFQEDIPLNMFVYPANTGASLPELFVEHSVVPQNPALVSPDDIAANREAWIGAWTETVLR
jgi:thiamine transport system substrate-binding protein